MKKYFLSVTCMVLVLGFAFVLITVLNKGGGVAGYLRGDGDGKARHTAQVMLSSEMSSGLAPEYDRVKGYVFYPMKALQKTQQENIDDILLDEWSYKNLPETMSCHQLFREGSGMISTEWINAPICLIEKSDNRFYITVAGIYYGLEGSSVLGMSGFVLDDTGLYVKKGTYVSALEKTSNDIIARNRVKYGEAEFPSNEFTKLEINVQHDYRMYLLEHEDELKKELQSIMMQMKADSALLK